MTGGDWFRAAVLLGLAGWLAWTGPQVFRPEPLAPRRALPEPVPGSLAFGDPPPGATLRAGIVDFRGTAPRGEAVGLWIEGRLAARTVGRADGTWALYAKLTDPGPVSVEVRTPGRTVSASFNVIGSARSTLTVDRPVPGERLVKGSLTVRGLAAPGEPVVVSVHGATQGKAQAGVDGRWQLRIEVNPDPSTEIEAWAPLEGELVTVPVRPT